MTFRMVLSTALALAIPAPGAAQTRPVTVGAYAAIGTLHLNCSCSGGLLPADFDGLAWHFTVAHPVTSSLRLGIEGTWWSGQDASLHRRLGVFSAIATWSPVSRLGLFFEGGVGYEDFQERLGANTHGATGLALQAGTGYRLPVYGGFALKPFMRVLESAAMKSATQGPGIYRPTMVRVGVGIGWE